MQQDRLDELAEMRFRHFERMTSAMIESQQEMMQILSENTKQLANLVSRTNKVEKPVYTLEESLTRLEGLLKLVLDDLAFIKEVLKPGG